VYPASLVTLILSDVVGDDLDVIASGPTAPDASTFGDVMGILKKYGLVGKLPKTVIRRMEAGMTGNLPETPKAGDIIFESVCNLIIGSNRGALAAAVNDARALGYTPLILSSMIEGEARTVSRVHGAIAREIRKTGNPTPPPACILSGGETTVTVTGSGLGGRCQEFALAAAIDISGDQHMVVLCAGTDGTDGPTDAAGAIADGGTVKRGEAAGLNAIAFLSDNDSYHFFKSLHDLVITGPTKTNVMDLHILLVG
jgi:hydroxypyruvate reductase